METTNKPAGLALLRQPFEKHQISKLPKNLIKDDRTEKKKCDICGGWHVEKVIHLDYVGHAAATDRLLEADPTWTWEPAALDKDGLPAFDRWGGLWINLTVCGVTRKGYGHADTALEKFDGDCVKECIGDALRNAGMRFGMALDLWHKGDQNLDGSDRKGSSKPENKDIDQFEYVIQMGEKNKLTGTKIKDHNLEDLAKSLENTLVWYANQSKNPHPNVMKFKEMLEKAISLNMK